MALAGDHDGSLALRGAMITFQCIQDTESDVVFFIPRGNVMIFGAGAMGVFEQQAQLCR